MTLTLRDVQNLDYTTPPECGGQIVEHSWAYHEAGYMVERVFDRSDRSVKYVIYDDVQDDEWDPWNGVPLHGSEVARIDG